MSIGAKNPYTLYVMEEGLYLGGLDSAAQALLSL